MSKKFTVKSLVISGLLAALSVILRLLGFPQEGIFRIELGFIPIALCGYLYGAIHGGAAYVVADIIGTLCTGMTPFFPITICKLLMGLIYGMFFFKGGKSIKNIVLCSVFIGIVIDLGIMPLALIPISGGKTYFAILWVRLLATAFNVPLRIAALYITFKYLRLEYLKIR